MKRGRPGGNPAWHSWRAGAHAGNHPDRLHGANIVVDDYLDRQESARAVYAEYERAGYLGVRAPIQAEMPWAHRWRDEWGHARDVHMHDAGRMARYLKHKQNLDLPIDDYDDDMYEDEWAIGIVRGVKQTPRQ